MNFFQKLKECGIDFFTGVPDSLLKNLGSCIYEHVPPERHIIAANEGNAIALAAGSYLASGNIPLVYLQNSGLGNTINPLLSMADRRLYAIPMLIIVGWRGQNKDAEQHLVQGPSTIPLIQAMQYPHAVLSKDEKTAFSQLESAITLLKDQPQPYFFIVEEGSFDTYTFNKAAPEPSTMMREEALYILAKNMPSDYFVVTTTGKTSREWYEVRERLNQEHSRDFLTVGSMGHTSSIALGMALRSHQHVVCVDGDGSMLMHLGALVVAGKMRCNNLHYIVLNNSAHESVGGQATPLDRLDYKGLFLALGFEDYAKAETKEELQRACQNLFSTPTALEIRIKQGSRADLSRPNMKAGELARKLREEFEKEKNKHGEKSNA